MTCDSYRSKFEIVPTDSFLCHLIEATRSVARKTHGSLMFAATAAKSGEPCDLLLVCDAGRFRAVETTNTVSAGWLLEIGSRRARTIMSNLIRAWGRLKDDAEAKENASIVLAAMGPGGPGHAHIFVPSVPGMGWAEIVASDNQHILIANRRAYASRLCAAGQPAIAIAGVGRRKLEAWLRRANVNTRKRRDVN